MPLSREENELLDNPPVSSERMAEIASSVLSFKAEPVFRTRPAVTFGSLPGPASRAYGSGACGGPQAGREVPS
jgi:hypothetical protein